MGASRHFLTGAAKRIAGWWFLAKQKAKFVAFRASRPSSGVRSTGTPKASSTSAAPEGDETPQFPFFTMGRPAPAAGSATVVETLKVPASSPPVPTTSPVARSVGNGSAARRIERAAPAISGGVAPRMMWAVKRDASFSGGSVPAKSSSKSVSISAAVSGAPR